MNAELIDLFQNVERSNHPVCNGCPLKYTCDKNQITRCLFGSAADALEAAEKRIAVLEAQLPKEGEWIESEDLESAMKGKVVCSICGEPQFALELTNKFVRMKNQKTNYCPNCGAKMKGANDEQIH